MKNIVENRISEMNNYLSKQGIAGYCEWNKTNGEISLFFEDMLYSQLMDFEYKFKVYLESLEFNTAEGYTYLLNLDSFLQDIFQKDIIQEDCKGDGIKLYRKNDKTFPAKSHPNTYLGVFETHRQVYEVMECYIHLLLIGKHEDVVFNVMKHEEIDVIKKEW